MVRLRPRTHARTDSVVEEAQRVAAQIRDLAVAITSYVGEHDERRTLKDRRTTDWGEWHGEERRCGLDRRASD